MQELVQEVLKWPLIIQGAIGSALFWGILSLGQVITSKLIEKASTYSKETRESNLRTKWSKYYGHKAFLNKEKNVVAEVQISLIYASFRNFLKSMVWITLGLLFSKVISVLGVVGFIGGLYYLFKALNIVQKIDTNVDVDNKLKEIEDQIKLVTKT